MTNNNKQAGLNKLYYFRITEDMWKRVKVAQEKETKKHMYPVSIASIMRKCVEIGLERMEGQK